MAGIISQVSGWLGLNDEAESVPSRPAAPVAAGEQRQAPRVTQIRPRRSATDVNEIYTIEPTSYADAREVAANYRLGIPVIVNMAEMSEIDSRHMLDFMLGLKEGLEGHMKRVTQKVYLLTPNHVAVNDEDGEVGEGSDDLLVRP
jgi:cell division inhibitor SepF